MSVNGTVGKKPELRNDPRVPRYRAWEVHELSQTDHPRFTDHLLEVFSIEHRTRGLERSGGDTGREHYEPVHAWSRGRLYDVADALEAHDVRDLVSIGKDRRYAAGDDSLRETRYAHHRALEVDVGVGEPGRHVPSTDVNGPARAVLAIDPDHGVPDHDYRGGVHRSGKDVDQPAVGEQEIDLTGAARQSYSFFKPRQVTLPSKKTWNMTSIECLKNDRQGKLFRVRNWRSFPVKGSPSSDFQGPFRSSRPVFLQTS